MNAITTTAIIINPEVLSIKIDTLEYNELIIIEDAINENEICVDIAYRISCELEDTGVNTYSHCLNKFTVTATSENGSPVAIVNQNDIFDFFSDRINGVY